MGYVSVKGGVRSQVAWDGSEINWHAHCDLSGCKSEQAKRKHQRTVTWLDYTDRRGQKDVLPSAKQDMTKMLYFDLPVCGFYVAFLLQENGQERKSILWSVKLFCGLP